VNSRLKKWMRTIGHPKWDNFSSHSGRRGAITEACRMGIDEPVQKNAGKWKGSGYAIYNQSKHWDGLILSSALLGKDSGESALALKREMEKESVMKGWTGLSSAASIEPQTSTEDSVAVRADDSENACTVSMGKEAALQEVRDWVAETEALCRSQGLPSFKP